VVKCSGVLQCSNGLSNKVSNIIRRLMDNMKLLLICILLLSRSIIFLRFYFLSMYIWFYSCLIMQLFIYIVMTMDSYCMFICMATLTEGFPCFSLSCKANVVV
jgi:hypothetical protein